MKPIAWTATALIALPTNTEIIRCAEKYM